MKAPAYPDWISKYTRIPFQPRGRTPNGVDCWGLIWLIYAREYRIELPSLSWTYSNVNDGGIPHVIEDERKAEVWTPVKRGAFRLGDVLIFRRGPLPRHVAFALGHGEMLHIESRVGVLRERANGPVWKQRLYGAYRHRDFPA